MSSSACRGDAGLGLDRRPRLDGWTEVPKRDESQAGLVGAEVGHRIALDLNQLSAVLVDRVEDAKRDVRGVVEVGKGGQSTDPPPAKPSIVRRNRLAQTLAVVDKSARSPRKGAG
jgi:hypothetical protein